MKEGDVMVQYKLVKIPNENTLIELKSIFYKDNIKNLKNSNLAAIKYDYSVNTYTDMMKKISDLDLSQCIITSDKFINFIENSILNEKFKLQKVKFIDSIQPEIESKINSIIFELKRTKNKEFLIDKLLNHLEWIMIDTCIDILSLSFNIKIQNYPFNAEVTIYNNGVIFMDTDETFEYIEILLGL